MPGRSPAGQSASWQYLPEGELICVVEEPEALEAEVTNPGRSGLVPP